MLKKLRIAFLFLLTTVLFVACGKKEAGEGTAATPAKGPRIIKLSHVFQVNEPLHQSIEDAAKRINGKLAGQIEIQVYPNGELPSYKDGIEQVVRGTDFISVEDPTYIGDYVPDFTAIVGPMLYDSYEEYEGMVKTEFVKGLEKKAEEKGIKVLALDYLFGFRNIVSNRDIVNPEDMKGFKIRVPMSKLFIETFNDLGANPVGMPWSETISALQQNVIDGLEGSYATMAPNKIWELRKNVALSKHFLGTCGVYISTKVWDSFTDEQKKVIAEEFADGAKLNNENLKKLDEGFVKDMKDNGMKFNEINRPAFVARTKKIYETFPGFTPGIFDILQEELKKIREEEK